MLDYSFNKDNTKVVVGSNQTTMFLHGNAIARKASDGTIEVSLAGWNTNTTKERLRGIVYELESRKGKIFLNGKEINSRDWYRI